MGAKEKRRNGEKRARIRGGEEKWIRGKSRF